MVLACFSWPGYKWVTMATLYPHQNSHNIIFMEGWCVTLSFAYLAHILWSFFVNSWLLLWLFPVLLFTLCPTGIFANYFCLCLSFLSLFFFSVLFTPNYVNVTFYIVFWCFMAWFNLLDRQLALLRGAQWAFWVCIQLDKDHYLGLPWQPGGRSQDQGFYQGGSLM